MKTDNGISQGSVLSPVLLIIDVNDKMFSVFKESGSIQPSGYTDDVPIYHSVISIRKWLENKTVEADRLIQSCN